MILASVLPSLHTVQNILLLHTVLHLKYLQFHNVSNCPASGMYGMRYLRTVGPGMGARAGYLVHKVQVSVPTAAGTEVVVEFQSN